MGKIARDYNSINILDFFMEILQEKLRPQTLEAVKGLNKCRAGNGISDKQILMNMADEDTAGCIMLIGSCGLGKTTVGKAFAKRYLKKDYPDKFLIKNASGERGIDIIKQDVYQFASMHPEANGKRQVILFDEADGLTYQAQEALKNITEELSHNCIFIFSLNKLRRMDEALISRSKRFYFQPLPFNEFEQWFAQSCQFVHITYSAEVPQQVYNYYKGDLRAVITDFLEPYKNSTIPYWRPNKSVAEEVFNAKDRVAKFLEVAKREIIEPEDFIEELYELSGKKNTKVFLEASASFDRANPTMGIMYVLQKGFE
jgi:DNA polymerase III delta prime subunit